MYNPVRGLLMYGTIYDILHTQSRKQANQARKANRSTKVHLSVYPPCYPSDGYSIGKEVRKGVRWMPRLLQAMKDVISCEKLRVGANGL